MIVVKENAWYSYSSYLANFSGGTPASIMVYTEEIVPQKKALAWYLRTYGRYKHNNRLRDTESWSTNVQFTMLPFSSRLLKWKFLGYENWVIIRLCLNGNERLFLMHCGCCCVNSKATKLFATVLALNSEGNVIKLILSNIPLRRELLKK